MVVFSKPAEPFPYSIGVDVGGTNTDAVIIDTTARDRAHSVIAAHKATTTSPNVTEGIEDAVQSVLQQCQIDRHRIASLAIRTTHFINAIVEHDQRHLSKVAVIRLSKSFTREVPPFPTFWSVLEIPCVDSARKSTAGFRSMAASKHQLLSQVVAECVRIRQLGIDAVAISQEIPGAAVVCSSEISNLGFLERENASILNASINRFAKRTIGEFRTAMKRLGLRCGLYLTQNDGTLLDAMNSCPAPDPNLLLRADEFYAS